jgi:hypothetical protein
MATPQRRAGLISFKVSGKSYDAKGSFSYNLGAPKRDAILGADTVHGFSEAPQVPYIEGQITDRVDLDLKALLQMEDETVTLRLGNEKTIALSNAWYAAEGKGETEQGNIEVRFEGLSAEEV